MNSLKPLILAILLTTLSLTSTYAENNETNTTQQKEATVDKAMEKIDSIEDDILSSLEAEAKQNQKKKK